MRAKQLQADLKRLKELGIPLDKWIDIEDRVYHNSPGISASGLKEISKCPAYYKFKKDNRTPDAEKSEILIVGSAVHTYILEPTKFRDSYLVAPTSDKRKKAWKDFVVNIDPRDKEKPILRKESMDMLLGVKNSLMSGKDQYGSNIFNDIIHSPKTKREMALYTIDKKRGVLLRIKVDINFDGIMFDLKSTKSAKIDNFMKDAANLGYGLQGAFYLHVAELAGKKSKGFGFIAIEKTEPYLSSTVMLSPRDIILSDVIMNKRLDEYTYCLDKGLWYGYNGINKQKHVEPMLVEAEMPNWYRYDIESQVGFTI